MALNAIISFSDMPLKFGVLAGALIALVGFIMIVIIVIKKLYFVDFLPGYSSTISTILLVGGLQILMTGLASIYIGKIFKEVQDRPLYIVKKQVNFSTISSQQ